MSKQSKMNERRWGAWRYNPDNLTLEIDSKVSGGNPYYVDLERCSTSSQVLDWLCQLRGKKWCSEEQVGYLLSAIDDLAEGLQSKMCAGACAGIGKKGGKETYFNMSEHLQSTL